MNITLVTGNKGKLTEWQRMFPKHIELEAADIDLDEIQSSDLRAIAGDKAKRAYAQLKRPVIVEDVSAGLESLGGMPGPFIKYFELSMGMDALYLLGHPDGSDAIVVCTVAFYDGTTLLIGHGEVHGTTAAARGTNGFGFDSVFQPAGQTKTYAEMDNVEKDAISHRSVAIKDIVRKLETLVVK